MASWKAVSIIAHRIFVCPALLTYLDELLLDEVCSQWIANRACRRRSKRASAVWRPESQVARQAARDNPTPLFVFCTPGALSPWYLCQAQV